MQNLNIAYCFDANYQQHAAASAMSVISNFKLKPDRLAFHFLTDTPTPEMTVFAADLERLFGCSVTLYEIGAYEDTIRENLSGELLIGTHWTIATFFRLFLPVILPSSIDRLLYLDCDTIVLDDVSQLFELDFGQNPLAAVIDPEEDKAKSPIGVLRYYNAGVLMMELDRWRDNQISQKCFDYLATPGVPAAFLDQDAINKVLEGQIFELPMRWNRQVTNLLVSDTAFASLHQHVSICHFITAQKPWHAWYMNRVGEYYWAYLRASPWKNPVLHMPKTAGDLHKMALCAVKKGQLNEAIDHYEALVTHYQRKNKN
jgi:lipopolysaccharide biosynthesis glycosyltransferase